MSPMFGRRPLPVHVSSCSQTDKQNDRTNDHITAPAIASLGQVTTNRSMSNICLMADQAGFRKGRRTCDQVAALTTFIENGFQQNHTLVTYE